MGRAPCCDKTNVKKGPWSPEEDDKLKYFILKSGTVGNWIALPQKAGLKRCGKSCRLRWLNYLRPNIKHGDFSDEEDTIICTLYASIGSRWSIIAGQLPGRTDNDIKNYWNTKLKKKMITSLCNNSNYSTSLQPQFSEPPTHQVHSSCYESSFHFQLSNADSTPSNSSSFSFSTTPQYPDPYFQVSPTTLASSSDGSCSYVDRCHVIKQEDPMVRNDFPGFLKSFDQGFAEDDRKPVDGNCDPHGKGLYCYY